MQPIFIENKKAGTLAGTGLSEKSLQSNLSGVGFFRLLDECEEGGLVVNRQLRELFTIHFDPRGFDATDETAVVDAVITANRVDTDDPELAELGLLFAAIAVRVDFGAIDSVFCVTEKTGFISEIAFGFFQNFFATCERRGTIGGSRHVVVSLVLGRCQVAHFHVTRLA